MFFHWFEIIKDALGELSREQTKHLDSFESTIRFKFLPYQRLSLDDSFYAIISCFISLKNMIKSLPASTVSRVYEKSESQR